MDEWLFAHARDHQAVVDAIRAKFNIVLPVLPLDPMDPGDPSNWSIRHQDMHNSANGVLGTDGVDLQSVKWSDPEEREEWFWNQYSEHLAWHKRLGL